MLGELRGMFAFALWDGARRRMLLARDPYGIKPLYYADDGGTIRVASQVRALVAGGKVSTQFDPAGAAGFFLRGTVPEPFTMYRAIRALPAGSYMYVDANGVARTGSLLFDRGDACAMPSNAMRTSPRTSAAKSCTTRCSNRCAITWLPTFRSAHFSPPASTPPPSSRSRARPARPTCRR